MPEEIDHHRRRFLGTAAMTIATSQLFLAGSAAPQSGPKNPAAVPAIKPGTNTSFASLKQIDAGVLNVGYAEDGPADGPLVILLHGWPYDIHTYVDVGMLTDGFGRTIADVAEAVGVHVADVSRILPLAFLAPKITDAILRGRQPVELTARALMRDDLPHLWTDQLEQLGI